MPNHCPNKAFPSPSWPAEPPLADILGDPMFRQLMASDRVSMEGFTDLLSFVRQRLAR